MKRPGAFLLTASVVSLLSARPQAARAEEAPLPWTVRVEVAYSSEHNREAYREELQARVVQDLVSAECFQSVVTEGDADVVLHVNIDKLDVAEEKEFRGPPTGGPGEIVVTGATVTIAGTLEMSSASGSQVIAPKRFFRSAHAAPVNTLDDPLGKAFTEAYREPVQWAGKYFCRKRDKLRDGITKALGGK